MLYITGSESAKNIAFLTWVTTKKGLICKMSYQRLQAFKLCNSKFENIAFFSNFEMLDRFLPSIEKRTKVDVKKGLYNEYSKFQKIFY